MSSYKSRYAKVYDLFYSNKNYSAEASFIHNVIKKYGLRSTHRLLELACGTGSHALELEKKGYEITATDSSQEMIDCALTKASISSSKVNFKTVDMRQLDFANEAFDAVICLFDSIGYVVNNEGINQVLNGVCKHLQPGGLLIFDFWNASAMVRNYEPLRLRRYEADFGELLRISETNLDIINQLANVNYSIYILNKDGTYESFLETHISRYFLIQEMSAFLKSNGFTPVKWFAGFTDDEIINENTWHIVSIAKCNDQKG